MVKAKAVLKTAFREYSMWILFIVMYVVAGSFIPLLLTPVNFQNIIIQGTILGLLSIGMTFVMLIGEIDLSVIATMAFAPLMGLLALQAGLPFIVAPLLTVLAGAGVGLFNGLMTEKVGIPSLVQTLATWLILAGVILVITEGESQAALQIEWRWLGSAYIGPVRVMLVVFVLLVIVVWFFVKNTKTGLRLYLTGGNENSARAAGIPTSRIRILAFVLCAVLAAIAGYFNTAKIGGISAAIDSSMVGLSLAAPVISGVSLTGGRGNMLNVIGGAFIIQLIVNIIRLVPAIGQFYYQLTQGILVFAAVLIEVLRKRTMGIKK